MVRHFAAPLYKHSFFLLEHFRSHRFPALICKIFSCEPQPPKLLISKLRNPAPLLMPPRRLTRHSTPESSMAAVDLGTAEWERSKISTQDINMLKKLGISKKPKALCFPSEESYPTPPMGYRVSFVDHLICGLSTPIHPFLRGLLFIYGLQLHHLTPNSILHISIFITLCEAFLGVQPNWALWKRIFFCRRNGSPNVAYNIGGVVISVRPTVDYFDVKLPDSVQGWRKKWLIQEENHGCAEDNIPPFDGAEKILRRRSWDAEATEEEKATRVQPLQARKYPLWKYAGEKDADRLSVDLEVKDLEKLVRKISSLSKKDPVPSSCRVKPFSAANPLPKNHPNLVSLPPLPEGGEVEERAVVTDDNQEAPSFVNEPVDSLKSAGSSEKMPPSARLSPPPRVSPRNKRKRNDVKDSGTSKAEEVDPSCQKATYDPYLESLISSDDEEEIPTLDVAPRTSTSHTLIVSETPVEGEESSPPTALPMIKELVRIGSQFIGYREYASKTEEKLAEANKLVDTLAQKLEQSETARKKAELDASQAKAEADEAKAKAASVENLQKRLEDAETALNEHKAAQATRQTNQEFDLENPTNDPLLDALYLEFHGQEIREGVVNADADYRLFPTSSRRKRSLRLSLPLPRTSIHRRILLKMRQENMKIVENTLFLGRRCPTTVD
ncbi:hypothetical protein QYE76_063871 [Lolium multiflorum]|uniref:Transposase (putative) gypsy type domain-containing protein n=1 Tax=Lolium multiflorum TaxID=4521 RepID=A0AAD8W742_LOLMU|nr:hypothetical protein QYE76_063871 [Lolium multiflorum]